MVWNSECRHMLGVVLRELEGATPGLQDVPAIEVHEVRAFMLHFRTCSGVSLSCFSFLSLPLFCVARSVLNLCLLLSRSLTTTLRGFHVHVVVKTPSCCFHAQWMVVALCWLSTSAVTARHQEVLE